MVLRMQRNIGYLVNTQALFRRPDPTDAEEAGNALCPRIFDLPVLVFCIVGQVVIAPVLIMSLLIWPVVLSLEHAWGSAIRGIGCDVHRSACARVSQWARARGSQRRSV